jgi:transposase-like protein
MQELENYFCTNPSCKDYGIIGKDNINVHFSYGKSKRRMLYCRTCKGRFSETKCTAFFGTKYSPETVGAIIRVTAEGNGVRATARILGLDKNAVNRVILKAGQHCEKVLRNLLSQLELTEVQLDELWAFVEKKTLPKMKESAMAPVNAGYGRRLTRKHD